MDKINTTNWSIPKHTVKEMSKKQKDYCVVIPVINEGEKIKKELERIKQHRVEKTVDIIIADGGSTDGSLKEKLLKSMNVTTLLTKTDSGKLSAQLRMGYAYALKQGYKGIITVDGNNKDSVESIPLFVKKLKEGYDYIQGSRFIKGGNAVNTPPIRHIAVKLIHIPVINITAGYKYTDTTNGFRGYSSKYLLHKDVQPFRNIFQTYELLAYLSARAPQLKLKVTEVPVTRSYPLKGKIPTKISFLRGNIDLIKILWRLVRKKYHPQ